MKSSRPKEIPMKYPDEAGTGTATEQTVVLTGAERALLVEATKRHIDELMAEAAATEARPLQHELAQMIDGLEAIMRKLEGTRTHQGETVARVA
jgi:hypothetical protein